MVKVKLTEKRSGSWSPGLNEAERLVLFGIARDTLEWSVRGRAAPFDWGRYALTPRLKTKSATFVTFRNGGRLRGCMGTLDANEPMAVSVHRSAANAASDSRFMFDPIEVEELPAILTDVSILSPREPIGSPADFREGVHGICLSKRGHSAVYLPEVASEQGWTREQTLASLCEKAGLAPADWMDDARLAIFYSVVISNALEAD